MKRSPAITPVPDPHDTGISTATLLAHWPLDELIRVEPAAAGVNNRAWLLTTATGRFVLKIYRDATDPDRLAFEHALLAALDAVGLPFVVPTPIPAASGATVVPVGDERWSLFRRIPGRVADRDSEPDARIAGAALAALHWSLASVALDPAVLVPEAFSDLSSVHPAVPDPVDAIDRMCGGEAASITAGVMDRSRQLAAGWPRQLIHTDYYPANVLVSGDAVSGVLDFEYAGRGYRAMDVAIGLAAFSTKTWGDDWSWPVCAAFAGGYLRRFPLDRAELDAIHTLMLMREATSLVHWLGRHARGLTDHTDIEDRGRRFLAVHRWLDGNQDRLVRVLRDASGAQPEQDATDAG